MTAGGALTVSGTIITSGGTYLAGNPGRNAGAVTLTGSTVAAGRHHRRGNQPPPRAATPEATEARS